MDLLDEQYDRNKPVNHEVPNSAHKEDVMKILLATDNHIGYNEKDQVRGNDSVVAFEEILQLAQKHDVDMVLLGGDLFHDNKPSRRMVNATIELLRKYTLGDRPCQLEFISDPTDNFKHTKFQTVNYEDGNFNIAYPVFSIHGNHDDPSVGNLCALDVLSSCGLVNYFGKSDHVDKVDVSPILLKKGQTKLALYGMGCIRDERLHRLYLQKNITMMRPRQDAESWFNLFAVHQNRVKHSAKDYIPESFLGDFLDLVLWGHEHDCRIEPEFNGNFYVTQPGSSVATSLGEGESIKKHVGLLKIYKKNFTLTKIRLKTVRQFYFEDVVLSSTNIKPDLEDPRSLEKIKKYLKERVEYFIEKAQQEHTGHRNQPRLPLIRVRVNYSGGYETFSPVQFGQQFVDRVANPKDIILFTKKRAQREKGEILDLADADAHISESTLITVEDMVAEYLAVKGDLKLKVLSENGLGKALSAFVQKDDGDAITNIVKKQRDVTSHHLKDREIRQVEDISDSIKRFKDSRTKQDVEDEAEATLQESLSQRPLRPTDDFSDPESDNSSTTAQAKPGRGRGSRGNRGSRGGRGSRGSTTRGRGRGRGSKAAAPAVELLSSDDDVPIIRGTQSGTSRSSTRPLNDFFDSVPKPGKRKARGMISDSDDDDSYLPGRRKKR